jgi:hypothetical protein
MKWTCLACAAVLAGAAVAARAQHPGDVNMDGCVDIRDAAILMTNLDMQPALWTDGDLTGNGIVDGADYTILADNYGWGTPSPADPQAWQIWPEHDGGVPVGALPGYKEYMVYLVSDDPSNPAAAWSGSFDGPINQDSPLSVVDGHLRPDPICIIPPCRSPFEDSYFFFYENEILAPEIFVDTVDRLAGGFAIWGDVRQQQLPLAHLVIADGQQVVMSGHVTDPYGQGLFSTDLIIPEPAAGALLALGALALIRRRRR